jgi:hypothetical protein
MSRGQNEPNLQPGQSEDGQPAAVGGSDHGVFLSGAPEIPTKVKAQTTLRPQGTIKPPQAPR